MPQHHGHRQLPLDGEMLLYLLRVRFSRAFFQDREFFEKLILDGRERDCAGSESNGFSGPRDGHTDRYLSYKCGTMEPYVHSSAIFAHALICISERPMLPTPGDPTPGRVSSTGTDILDHIDTCLFALAFLVTSYL